jgi:hypothetical protein
MPYASAKRSLSGMQEVHNLCARVQDVERERYQNERIIRALKRIIVTHFLKEILISNSIAEKE